MGLVAWMVYFLKVIARLLSLVLVLSFGFASLAKHAAVTKFMEDFYTYHLVPKYQSWLSQAGLSLVLDGVVVRHVMSALEMLTALLCLLNWRKAGALLALLILLSGSKNVGGRSIDIPHLGSFKVYPNAFIQTIIAALIIVLPSGASKKRSEKEDDRLKQQ